MIEDVFFWFKKLSPAIVAVVPFVWFMMDAHDRKKQMKNKKW